MSTPKELYVGKKLRGTFQHSSFLAGGATSAAGKFTVQKGVLKGNSPSANKQFYSNDWTLSHFAHFAKVYKVWEFFRIQLVKKGVTDKAMAQLEKSVATKGDSLVSWKIQTTFQSSGNKALQLKYHDTGREKDCLPQVGQWNMMNKVLTMSYWSYPNIMVDRIQMTIRYSATKYLDLE